MDFGGCQNENDVWWRLFECFEQGVERLCREHVHFVDDIYFIAASAGGVGGFVTQVADVVDAVVRGGVHLDHVENATIVDAAARLTHAAGVATVRIGAVDRLCKDFSTRGFARAAHPRKEVGMPDMTAGNLILQCGDDCLLPDNVGKAQRSPFAIQRTIHKATSF